MRHDPVVVYVYSQHFLWNISRVLFHRQLVLLQQTRINMLMTSKRELHAQELPVQFIPVIVF